MHLHFLLPTVIPGNSSKCTIKSQQLFQIPAKKKIPVVALSELRKWSRPAGSLLTLRCGQNGSPRGHFMYRSLHHHAYLFMLWAYSEAETEKLKALGHFPLSYPAVFILESPWEWPQNLHWAPTHKAASSVVELPKVSQLEGSKVRIWTLTLGMPKHQASLPYSSPYCPRSHCVSLTQRSVVISTVFFPHLGQSHVNSVHKYGSHISIFAPAAFLQNDFSMMKWQNLQLAEWIVDTQAYTNTFISYPLGLNNPLQMFL